LTLALLAYSIGCASEYQARYENGGGHAYSKDQCRRAFKAVAGVAAIVGWLWFSSWFDDYSSPHHHHHH
jgi:hypothetical protein